VDFDMANRDAMTIFVNYRMLDYQGRYIGAIGVGLTIDAVYRLMKDYQQRYRRDLYFVNPQGQLVLSTDGPARAPVDLHARAGLGPLLDQAMSARGSYLYEAGGRTRLLNVHQIPELNWFLFVEKDEGEALEGIRRTLWINLLICAVITAVVLALTRVALERYHRRLQDAAIRDKLTGLYNRHAFAILQDQLRVEQERVARPLSVLLVDVDHFKEVNDRHGHAAGDQVLAQLATLLQDKLRKSDIAVRWGGEEFLVVLRDCTREQALALGEKLRLAVEALEVQVHGGRVPVSVSIGVGEQQAGETIDQVIHRADAGLYVAKNAGRNRVCVADTQTAL
jgi:diguanylate cyclase (GGDEF)-like protein